MGQRNRKLVTYGRSATSRSATNISRQGESDTTNIKNRSRSSSPTQSQRPGYADGSGSAVTGTHDSILVNPSPIDISVHDPVSSSDEGKTYTPVQKKRRKRISEDQWQRSMTNRQEASRDNVSIKSDSTKAAVEAASQQKWDKDRPQWESSRRNQYTRMRPIPRERFDDCNALHGLSETFGSTPLSGSASSSDSSLRLPSDTCFALSDAASNRKRLVDRLVASEQQDRGLSASPAAATATETKSTASYSVHSSAIHNDASKRELAKSKFRGTEADNIKNNQETTALMPSHLRSSTVTYARQRSFLTDISISSEIGGQDAPASFTAIHHKGHSRTATESGSFSLFDEDDDCSGTGPVRSIHELRRAGENARFKASLDSIFEDIEDTFNSTPGRCNGFIQLCEKLLEPRSARRFIECGFDKRLLEDITGHLDVISATLALSVYELISSCGPLSSTLLVPFWSKILVLSPKLLDTEENIILLAKRRHSGMPETVQAAIQDILPRLAFALSKSQSLVQVSPRLLALRCIHSTITKLREKDDTAHNIPLPLLNRLVDFLSLGNRTGLQKCSVGCFQVLILSFSILESYTLLSGSLTSDYQNAVRPLSRLHGLLFLKGDYDDRCSQIPVLYMRVILNITNSNPPLCTDFATSELVGGLVRKVVAGFRRLSKDFPVIQNNSLEAVVLALGSLINLTEESEPAKLILISKPVDNSETLFRTLLDLFVFSTGSTSEAHTVLEVKHNIAVGYLSILLAILCLDVRARREVKQSLNDRGLAMILSTVDEFLRYHQKVDLDLRPQEAAGGQTTAFMTKLQGIVGQVRHSEME